MNAQEFGKLIASIAVNNYRSFDSDFNLTKFAQDTAQENLDHSRRNIELATELQKIDHALSVISKEQADLGGLLGLLGGSLIVGKTFAGEDQAISLPGAVLGGIVGYSLGRKFGPAFLPMSETQRAAYERLKREKSRYVIGDALSELIPPDKGTGQETDKKEGTGIFDYIWAALPYLAALAVGIITGRITAKPKPISPQTGQ